MKNSQLQDTSQCPISPLPYLCPLVPTYALQSYLTPSTIHVAGRWWHVPLIPTHRRQRQTDPYKFKASLVYRVNFKTGSKATVKPCLKTSPLKKIKIKKVKTEHEFLSHIHVLLYGKFSIFGGTKRYIDKMYPDYYCLETQINN